MSNIQMVDLQNQYLKIKNEIDFEIEEVLKSSRYIGGPKVLGFEKSLAEYLGSNHVMSCANGTDALQIALMALGLKPGDEVIVPAFTYVATAEVIALLNLTPVMIDVEIDSFNTNAGYIEAAITEKTKAIIPVHLFGQCTDMEDIMALSKKYNLSIIEDNAQAIGCEYTFSNGEKKKAGTIGDIGTTSFFPSKNLGCYGDGGALMSNNDKISDHIRMISNHGQNKRYYHEVIGVNSRLDSLQAAVLNVKLKYLDEYASARRSVADTYDAAFAENDHLEIPFRAPYTNHVFHQYTLKVKNGYRDSLHGFLEKNNVPSNIYYPVPLYKQNAFSKYYTGSELENTEKLCNTVLSLPIHTEMDESTQNTIIQCVNNYFESI